MNRASEVFRVGQVVEILVRNSHYGQCVEIVGFSGHNPYNVIVDYGDGQRAGYNVSELMAIPRLGNRSQVV